MSCLQDAASYYVLIFFSWSGYNHHQDFSPIDLLCFSAERSAKSSSWKGVAIIPACSSWNKRILLKRCISPRTPSLTIGRFVNGFSEKVLVAHFETPWVLPSWVFCPTFHLLFADLSMDFLKRFWWPILKRHEYSLPGVFCPTFHLLFADLSMDFLKRFWWPILKRHEYSLPGVFCPTFHLLFADLLSMGFLKRFWWSIWNAMSEHSLPGVFCPTFHLLFADLSMGFLKRFWWSILKRHSAQLSAKNTFCPVGKQLCPTNLYKKRNLFPWKTN